MGLKSDDIKGWLTKEDVLLMISKDTPYRLYALNKQGNIIYMLVYEKFANSKTIYQKYILAKDEEGLLYMQESSLNKVKSGDNRYAITVTGGYSMDIQPLQPTEGSVIHLVKCEKYLISATTKEVAVAVKEIYSKIGEMVVWNVDISKELIKIAVYFKTKNVTQVYVRQMDKKSRIICMDNEITIDYVYDDFVFLWKDINIMIPFNEFSVRPYEKQNDEESEV